MGQNLILNMNDHGFVVSHRGLALLSQVLGVRQPECW